MRFRAIFIAAPSLFYGTFRHFLTAIYVGSISKIPTPRESELRALEKFPGREQVSYLNHQEVPYFTPDATRPDIIRELEDGTLEALEVKNYDLSTNLQNLCYELKRQVTSRTINLPEGTVQRIVLDVHGRGYSEELIQQSILKIQEYLIDVYPNIPVEILL